jgi:hypothetical protein
MIILKGSAFYRLGAIWMMGVPRMWVFDFSFSPRFFPFRVRPAAPWIQPERMYLKLTKNCSPDVELLEKRDAILDWWSGFNSRSLETFFFCLLLDFFIRGSPNLAQLVKAVHSFLGWVARLINSEGNELIASSGSAQASKNIPFVALGGWLSSMFRTIPVHNCNTPVSGNSFSELISSRV